MQRLLVAALAAVAVSVFSTPAYAGRIRYTVAPGDTLDEIADAYGVTVRDLRRWNDLDGDFIRVDQVLTIRVSGTSGERARDEYVVRSGDTGRSIARRHGVTVRELRSWNPDVDLDRIRVGQRLTIYVEDSEAGSRGTPNRGRLRGGERLDDGPGYVVRNPERSYGTPEALSAIRNAIARVDARFLTQPDIVVGDISHESGGRMGDHLSHQNGLDADITYYRLGAEDVCEYGTITADEMDVELQWYLFRTWMDQGLVEYIFVDYRLQAPLYEYARARGASDAQLAEWFQYPNRGSASGIIRHEPGHDDHFHVRFWPVETEVAE